MRYLLCAIAGILLCAAGAPRVGAQTRTGEIELGYEGVSGDVISAKFNEYRDVDPSLIGNGWFLLEGEDGARYLRGAFEASELGHSMQRRIVGEAEKGGVGGPNGFDPLEKPRA